MQRLRLRDSIHRVDKKQVSSWKKESLKGESMVIPGQNWEVPFQSHPGNCKIESLIKLKWLLRCITLSNIINIANNGLKGNAQLLFSHTPPKIRPFMSLHYIFLNNTKNINHRHISLPGTDLCKYLVLQVQPLSLFNILEMLQEN